MQHFNTRHFLTNDSLKFHSDNDKSSRLQTFLGIKKDMNIQETRVAVRISQRTDGNKLRQQQRPLPEFRMRNVEAFR
jgi:hypothetical protein